MKNKLFISSVVVALASSATLSPLAHAADATEVAATAESGVAAVMRATRNNDVDIAKADAEPPELVLNELPTYLNDESTAVRLQAVDLAARVGRKAGRDLQLKRRAMRLLFQVATTHSDASLAGYAARRLNQFTRADFTDDMKQTLAASILSRKEASAVSEDAVILAGIADVQAVKGRLREWASPAEIRGVGWRALLSLARLGDKAATQTAIGKVEGLSLETRETLLPSLAFTRQPEAITTLVRYLFSDEITPSHGDSGGAKVSYRAVDLLEKIIEGFPQRKDPYMEKYVATARAWVTETGVRNLRIKQ